MNKKEWKKERECELPSCKSKFIPQREWQKFCSSLCAGRSRNSQRTETMQELKERLAKLEAENRKLKGE